MYRFALRQLPVTKLTVMSTIVGPMLIVVMAVVATVATAVLVWEAEAMALAEVAMKAASTTAFSTVAARMFAAAKSMVTLGATEAGTEQKTVARPVAAVAWTVVTAPVAAALRARSLELGT